MSPATTSGKTGRPEPVSSVSEWTGGVGRTGTDTV